MRIIFITGLLLLLPFFGFSQGEFNNWYFGNKAGITFNSGTPVVLTDGQMLVQRASICVSDSLGNLLFYSDGQRVWNRNHQVMPNGTNLQAGLVQDQSVNVIQKIEDDSSYYIFTMKGEYLPYTTYGGLHYSVVNMRLDGGLGDIEPGQKEIAIQTMNDFPELMTTARHRNNHDAWVIVRNVFNANNFAAYLVTSNGITTTPVISQSSLPWNPIPYGNVGTMRVSPDGTKLVYPHMDTVEFCNFNATTGQITPMFKIRPGTWMDSGWGYLEFSLDSRFLYCSTGDWPWTVSKIYQYDATLTDSTRFKNSEIQVGYRNRGVHLQRGPDGKIYGGEAGKDSLSIIHNPTLQGVACNYQPHALSLQGRQCYEGMPDLLQRYYVYIGHIGQCQYQPVQFNSIIWPPADSIHWDFGDPASGSSNNSNLSNPQHVFANPGNYTITLFARHNDKRTDTSWQTINILAGPQPSLGPNQTICSPQTATFDAGACIGCTYLWGNLTTGQPNVGTGQTYTTGTAGTYMVTVTGQNGCTGKDTIQLVAGTPAVVTASITTGNTTVCAGTPVTFTASGNPTGTSPSWQWKVNGVNTGIGGQVFTYTPANGDCITCVLTSNADCVTGNPATSNQICMTVNLLNPVNLSISSTASQTCAGTPVTFNAFPTNPGNNPVYQWKINAGNVNNANNAVFTYTPVNGDCVTCELTSDIDCPTGNPALSNSICMTVDQPLPVSVTVTTPQTTVCAGTSVTFTANPTHGGTLPMYQWKINTLNISGANNSTYTYLPLNGDVVTCQLTSSYNCVTGNPALSPPVTMTVNQNFEVTVSISASANPFCAGSQVTFTAIPSHGGLVPGYQWKVNTSNVINANNATFTYVPVDGDVVACELTSSENCVTGNPALSNAITMTVNTNLPAGVSISTLTNPFCPGASVTFTATPVNGGSTPGYQWKVNASNVINAINAVFTYSPLPGDLVSCVMTSNLSCVTGNPVTSAPIAMIERAAPNVSFIACFDTITTVDAKPIKLNGGLPAGGQYSGPGVNTTTGIFKPSEVGTGLKTINYTYTNVYTCSAIKSKTILVQPNPSFTCGNNLTDIRDGKSYPTVLIGTQCWMEENLDFGFGISDLTPQTDNCVAEKFIRYSIFNVQYSTFYQWDELMRYDPTPASQGLCPPGWHVPTDAEWATLINFYQGNGSAGRPLQDTILNGFKAFRSGVFYLNSSWSFMDFATIFWTSTSSGPTKAISHGMNLYNFSVSLYPSSRANAFPVRCLQDM